MYKKVFLLLFLGIINSNLLAEDKNAKEAVDNLKAYALYKMGQFDEAKEIWDKLAKKGNTTALINLSNLYEQGFGVTKDKKEALKYVIEAANLNDQRAQYELGINYEKGLIIQRDIDKAAYWLEKSAINGSKDGIRAYSILLATGKGKGYENLEAKEKEIALKWLYIARDQQIMEAEEYIKILEKNK